MKKAAYKMQFSDLRIINDDYLQDGPWTWASDTVADTILDYMKHLKATKKVTFQYIITFDENGVSGHPNHNSIFYGVKNMMYARKTNA
jgi:LmbE family N-acetylglucosaminyl deacetylase